ncbi:M20 family metallopeptidase [Phyllobacterium zundukense]|uniref:M20 family metallopeptidase n=1 Tax=Phyllobacterium zundukense TaxID=1867719 RepID=A0ACD4CVV8_9HYPH|nr:M20 family metallopeptidase [Phyllobacterium zundukense]UXN57617.1 M20 family metallopeptidase [Phyllobacterium zundukense]
MRHAMHREPELSNNEWKTQKRIRETLESFGLTGAKTFHKTGVYIDIQGLAAGPNHSVAVRGDIDALPIQEDRNDLAYSSQVPGVMHACGHDMHSSIALGAALAFHRMRENFSGKIRVFFQPAEEAEPLGGRTVAEENLLDGFDAAVGFHVRTNIAAGSYGARAGAVTNSSDQFALELTGTMAHGASPHAGVDAIAIAGAFINEVQKVVSREMPVDDRAIVTIGTIHGGEATNIICPSVTMTGTIRTGSRERRELLVRRVGEIADGVAALHRGKAEFRSQLGEPPVVNDPAMVERFRQLVVQSVGEDKYVEGSASAGSDDFGFYSSCVPSIYFWFGSKEPGNESGVHTPTFGASDEILIPTTELAIRYCWELLYS